MTSHHSHPVRIDKYIILYYMQLIFFILVVLVMSDDEEFLSDELDDISLSESDLAELERQLEEEEENATEEEVADDNNQIDDAATDEDELAGESVEEVDENQESLCEEDEEKREAEPTKRKKLEGLSELEEQIENELDELAEGVSELQFAVKLRMRLKEELLEGFHLQHTLTYISEKVDKLKNTEDTDTSAPQEEIDDCNERINELKELLEHEKQQNIKMHEAIQKLNQAKEKVIYDRELAEKDLSTAEKRRQAEASECSAEIKYQTSEFVHCKREQNQTVASVLQHPLRKNRSRKICGWL